MMKHLRRQLSEFYINFMTRWPLPFVGENTIESFRRIEKKIREESQDTFLRTRIPEGVEIDYLHLRLFDVFQVEDVNALLKGLKKLFPDFGNSFWRGDSDKQFIERAASQITRTGWVNVGAVCKQRYIWDRSWQLKSLPSFVKCVRVRVYKVSASMFVISYDVYWEEDVSRALAKMQSAYYKPDIKFKKFFPRGVLGGGYSITFAEHVMRREIVAWLDKLRYQIEIELGRFLKGDFLKSRGFFQRERERLPAVEVYAVRGASSTDLQKWLQKSAPWLTTLGFDTYTSALFTNGNLFFFSKSVWEDEGKIEPSYRVVVLWDSYLRTLDTKMYANDKSAVIENVRTDFLDPILPSLATLEILHHIQERFEQTRRKVLTTIRPAVFHGIYFGQYVKLGDIVLRTSFMLDRISRDVRSEFSLTFSHLKQLSDFLKVQWKQENQPETLDKVLVESVEYKLEMLKEHINFATTWLSQYLALRNMAVTYFLALVAGITAIISLWLSYQH